MRINDLLLPKYANVNVDDGAVPSPLFPSPQFAQAARDLAAANGPRSPWPPGFQPPTSAQLAMAAAAQAAHAQAQASGNGGANGDSITSPLSPWGFPTGQHSPIHLVHMAAANAAVAGNAGGSLSPEQKQPLISGPMVRLGPVPAAVHPMSAHVQQAGQLTSSSSSSQDQQYPQQQSPEATESSPQVTKGQAPQQPNAAPVPLSVASSLASASASILTSHGRQQQPQQQQHPSPMVLTHMPTPRSTPPVHQQVVQQQQQQQAESRDHRDRSAMSQHPGSEQQQHSHHMYNQQPSVPLITASGLPLGWHPMQPYPPLATMPFQAQQHLATLGGTPATSGASTPNMDDPALAGRPRAGSAPPPGGRRGSARPGGAPMLDLPQPRNEGSPAPHHHQQHLDSRSGSSNSASPGPFMSAAGSQHPPYHAAQRAQPPVAHHHHGRSSYSAVGPHASIYDPSLGGAPGPHGQTPAPSVSAHSAAAALQPLVDPSQSGMQSALVLNHMPHPHQPHPAVPMPAPHVPSRSSRIPVMDDDVVVLHTTDNMQRPFACIHCGRAFWRRYDCKRHMRVHTDERPYGCSGCDRTFARKDALNRHLQAAGCSAGIAAQAAQLRGAGVDPVQAVAAVASANAAASAMRNGVGGMLQATTEYHHQLPPQNQHQHHQQHQQQQQAQREEHELDQSQQQGDGTHSQPHSPSPTSSQPEVMPATTVADLPVPIQGAWRASARASRENLGPRGRGRTSNTRPLHLNIQPHAVQQQQMAMLAAAAAAAAAAGSPVTLSHPASATSLHSPAHLVQPSPIAQQFQQVEMTAAAVMAAGVLSPVVATMPVVDAAQAGLLAANGLMSPTHVVPSTPTVASMPVDSSAMPTEQHHVPATAGGSPQAAVSSEDSNESNSS